MTQLTLLSVAREPANKPRATTPVTLPRAVAEPSRKQQEQQQDPMELLAAHVRLHRREFVDLIRGLVERDADHDRSACAGYPFRGAL